jgi:hypothetical protein
MTAALGLPLALLLGIVIDLTAGGVGRLAGAERRWWGRLTDRWSELRRLWGKGREAERVAVLETVGGAGSLLGAGIAGAAAIGAVPGTLPLVYLGLLAAALGGHVAASASVTGEGSGEATGARLRAVMVEPAFVVALGAAFLRWGAVDLEGARGAQEVLGPGLTLGPPLALAGLAISAVVIAVGGAVRAAPASSGRPSGASLVIALARWAAGGATALVVASLVGGPGPGDAEDAPVLAAAALGAAIVAGVAGGMAGRARGRALALALSVLVLASAAGAVLVAMG